jgi:trk system potassium uptake protein TrkH
MPSAKSYGAGNRRIALAPPSLLALLYVALLLTGACLLKLPFSAHVPVDWSQALFTATSAVTVTGLVVMDTGNFSVFGQLVILCLIQLGGLGIMTFAVLLFSMLNLPIGMPQRIFLREEMNQTSMGELVRLVWLVLRVVIVCELAGIVVLSCVFVPEFGWVEGLWSALFHSVSAFNNAGFSLYPDSLSRWATNPVINVAIPALIIVGGIGFSVLSDIYRVRRWRKYSLHSKLMLVGTGLLLVCSVLIFALLEWTNPGTLGQFSSSGDRLMASWFQAVTTRTAGFSTMDIGSIHDSTALLFISLMLIGGGSSSTAGGIKVTTFIVLVLSIITFFRRSTALNTFGRSVSHEDVMKVLALTAISLLTVMMGTFILSISHDGDFLDMVFEVVSAFGTVGLSRGATGELDQFGRFTITVIMFIGRIGPLTLGFLLATRVFPRIRYPAGNIHLG